MGRFIVKIKDKYLEWSSVIDAPLTYGMTLKELHEYIKEEYGSEGIKVLPDRIARADATGSSAYDRFLEDHILTNRAGGKETTLSEQEIYDKFCKQEADDGRE